MSGNSYATKSVTVSDGVQLRYLEAGSGPTLFMIPGWSQTAEQFRHQLDGLSDRYRVIALDMRGHGESDKPPFGYRIARLAKDVHDVLEALDLRDVALLGHSMGCSVIWCYWDLWGAERLSKLLLIDQMPFIVANPAWEAEERELAGAILDAEALYGTVNGLAGPGGGAVTDGMISSMLTAGCAPDDKAWIIARNLRMARPDAATLLYNHATQDWRDVIPRIDIPTLVVAGRISFIPWKSVAWVHEQIRGSQFEIFEEEEGGQHFMFIENAPKFNRVVADFLG